MLYKLAQDGFRPAKYFSIDRVFRNEAIDKTHLAEFHQIEGTPLGSFYNLGIATILPHSPLQHEHVNIAEACTCYTCFFCRLCMLSATYAQTRRKTVGYGKAYLAEPNRIQRDLLHSNVPLVA